MSYQYIAMSTERRTLLEKAVSREASELGYTDDDPTRTETSSSAPTGGIKSTTIDGQQVDLASPRTEITFDDEMGILSGEYGRPRPMDFFHARQLGQTPQMELIKNVVTQQLTGGHVRAVNDDGELEGAVADFAGIVEDIYRGPHFQEKSLDNLITDTVNDLVDYGWAYHEKLSSESGDYSVAGFKPLPPLQILHHIDDESGELIEEPAFYHAPHKASGGHIQIAQTEPTALARDDVVVMRDPHSSRSDSLYGESIATRVREWLELITDVDVHQKRHYADSHLPAGFLHFKGAVEDDDLEGIHQDIDEVAGDPQELVTTTTEEDAKWIPNGDQVADLEAIQQQKWYFKLVLAAIGLNQSEINLVESSGFAKEVPALQRMIYKKVTKPFSSAIFGSHNTQAVDDIGADVGITDVPFRIELERNDPVQEQIERDETMKEWSKRAVSLNELRGAIGRGAVEVPVELEDIDEDGPVNVADLPRYVVDLLLDNSATVNLGTDGDDEEDV